MLGFRLLFHVYLHRLKTFAQRKTLLFTKPSNLSIKLFHPSPQLSGVYVVLFYFSPQCAPSPPQHFGGFVTSPLAFDQCLYNHISFQRRPRFLTALFAVGFYKWCCPFFLFTGIRRWMVIWTFRVGKIGWKVGELYLSFWANIHGVFNNVSELPNISGKRIVQ